MEAVYEKSYETIIGNCDTHVFLGSNSQETVEYFSKALGEKTVSRESISTNRDNQNTLQGRSYSDQINARALLTPDELRRFDNDYCIIYEKGVRPIKAKKYYYFLKPEARKLAEFALNHNDARDFDRGTWRKFNPYNPYVEDSKKGGNGQVQDLKIESLDDLFVEDEVEETKKPVEAPELPQKEEKEEVTQEEKDDMDLQKELEAKFDELFGTIE